jgi:Putative DNA-binding domain
MGGVVTPRSLAEWNIDAILEILSKGLFETEDYDFKEMLPHPSDQRGKERLRATCCAFANSSGGFLVFGINADRNLPVLDRLSGLPPALDFPQHFGAFPEKCVPGVPWSFKNPAIQLAAGTLIHVVEIPRSWKAPHAVGSAQDGWRFFKRTNQGDEGMNMDEVAESGRPSASAVADFPSAAPLPRWRASARASGICYRDCYNGDSKARPLAPEPPEAGDGQRPSTYLPRSAPSAPPTLFLVSRPALVPTLVLPLGGSRSA